MKAAELFESKEKPWNKNPEMGWWLDQNIVTFYHGTNINNLEGILQTGIYAPKEGPTAGWVSLALDPNTARGYASMYGGESSFRASEARPKHVPMNERVVFELEIPQKYFLPKMAEARGNMENERDKLINKDRYEAWKASGKSDSEYYALTEIRLPDYVPNNFITGWMLSK